MERLFLAIITMSLIALVTAISLGPMSEPRSKGEFLRERESYLIRGELPPFGRDLARGFQVATGGPIIELYGAGT